MQHQLQLNQNADHIDELNHVIIVLYPIDLSLYCAPLLPFHGEESLKLCHISHVGGGGDDKRYVTVGGWARSRVKKTLRGGYQVYRKKASRIT